DISKTTQSWPCFSSRRTMLAPMRPRPTIPSCIELTPVRRRSSRTFFELAITADQGIGRTVMIELGLCAGVEFRNDAQRQHLAELDPPLVEGVDVPDGALREHAVLVERDELPERGWRQPLQ